MATALRKNDTMPRSKVFLDPPVHGVHTAQPLKAYLSDEPAPSDTSNPQVGYLVYHPGDGDGNVEILRFTRTEADGRVITRTEVALGAWDERTSIPEDQWKPINGENYRKQI